MHSLLVESLNPRLDDAVSTILTVIDHIYQARRGILEYIEVMAQKISLHERLLFGHGRDVDNLLAHQLIVFVCRKQQVGKVFHGLDRNAADAPC